ncbi:hypothetical protein EUGRSUZ_D00880 [Eucalyptus grandis]|uniref:Uncharacterized protein n=2 Tax=Eucalyptus grandis TaxID=71139 RepID=A0ACC3L5P8_EUCGR|nr:hypothetical protein EUGRSUZ_D00880 [Eucalyptus grandis]
MSLTRQSFRFLFLLLSLLFVLSESTLSSSSSSNSIQNLLQSQGLPGGLFPHDVKSFALHPDGLLEVLLDRPCLAKFDTGVYFDSVVRANLTYGSDRATRIRHDNHLFLGFFSVLMFLAFGF